MAITRSQTKAMYGGRSHLPSIDHRKTTGGTHECSSWSSRCTRAVKAIHLFVSTAFLPLLSFTLYCIVMEIIAYIRDVQYAVPLAHHFDFKFEDFGELSPIVYLTILTFFSGLIWFTPTREDGSGVTGGRAD